ncbi:TonB-dependent receptor [Leptobacterium flavescens]|uniref:TonB-dependent receptor n=1 Tax=Leptobacterium flavescens TaxID=472055 RepID=A0A6P0UKW8_9FLAO|nr:carboxypeptidase regulatory-like domain-containing protein [Leptobacterium flavescens]NER12538.1 TonB-dependent receptor [Leptobacterium flavescens]
MKQFYITLFLGLGILCSKINAQNVRVEGVVKDSLNAPLELANVLALNPEDQSIQSYAITDESGRFALSLPNNKTYKLKVSYLGYKTKEEDLVIGDSREKIFKEIVLFKDVNALDEVEVVQELPISVRGDTIVYKADAFTNGKEKKLKNVLEKLPGFEVDKNGDVKVQGKKVDKVLVEGKKFFDGDTKLATKNIPADAVDKVEVLQDFNEVEPTRGLNNEESLALNIKLKDGKKNIVFGDLAASIGHDERYFGHANVFYYSPKKSLNLIADANNIGEQAFTLQDYFRFSGGFSNLAGRSGSSFRVSSDDIGLSLLQDNRAEEIISNFGALNFNLNPNKKWQFSGFLIGSDIDTDLRSSTLRTYLRNEDDNNLEVLESNINQENKSGLFKFTGKYTPSKKLDISYNAFLKKSEIAQANNRLSDFAGVQNSIQSNSEQQPFSINQSFDAFYAKDAKNVFSFQAQHLYKEQDPFYNLITSEVPFNGGLPLIDDNVYNLLQNKEILTNKFDASFNYYYVLNKKNHINFIAGSSLSNQKLVSNIRQRESGTGDENELGGGFLNDADYNFSDIYFGLRYKVKFGSFVVSPGANVHFYNTTDTQQGNENKLSKTLVTPSLFARYSIRKSESLTLNYSVNAEFTDVNNIVLGTVISSYNTLFDGNRNLENQLFHRFVLRYTNFNSFNFTNIFGTLTYTKTIDGINNTVVFNGINQVLSPINSGDVNDVLSANASFEKRFVWFKTKLTGNLSYSSINNTINGLANTNTSFTQNYRLSFETNFRDAPNFEIGFDKTINNYEGSQTDSRFITNAPFANVEVGFLKHFLFTADYVYTDYINRNNDTNNSYDFLNASLFYQKEGSKWEFKVSGTNLLNTVSINRDSFSDFLISTNQYFVQPRYVVFGIKYDL